MNEFLIELQAILDREKSKGNLNKSINRIQNRLDKLKVQAEIDPKTISNLVKQLEGALNQKINISNININQSQISKSAQQTGQQIGNQINQGMSQSLERNTRVLDAFRLSLQNIGMGSEEIDAVANRINNLGIQIQSLNQSTSHIVGKRGNKDILSVDISGVDKLGQAIKLTEQYNKTTGDLIRSMDSVSTAQQKAGTSTNTFAKQQSQAVANLTNQINQLNRAANDQNASRPIADSTHLNNLATAYNDIISAIQRMGNASSNTFVTEQNNVKTLISNFKSLVSEYRNAENVSTKMKGTDFTSGLSIARNDLEKFKADAKDFPQIIKTINDLDKAIAKVGDASSLNKFNNDLRVAKSELAKIKSETSSTNRNKKVGINVSGLQSKIADLQRISPEIDKFEAEINGAKVTVQSLLTDLSKVNTQSDFSVINSKWKAFTDSAKSAGIAISEVSAKSDSLTEKVNKIQLSFNTGTYDAKVTDLIAKANQWTDVSGRARINTANLQKALDNLATAEKNLSSSNTVANREALIAAEKQLDMEVKKTTNDIKAQNAVYAKDSAITSLHNKIQEFYDKNSAAHLRWGNQLKKMLAETASGAELTRARVAKISAAFNQVQVSARQANKLGKSFFDTIKSGMSAFSYWTSSTFIVMRTITEIKEAITTVKQLDTALVDLKKTASMTATQLEDFYYNSNEEAKQMGVTTEEILKQAAAWSRLGYSSAEAATKMAKYSSMFASISPGMDIDSATDGLVSVMKAFKIGTEDVDEVVDGIMSKINIIGNTRALSNSDIVEFLTRSSSAMAEANNNLEDTIALGTAAVEITRDAASVGQALKTVSMRIRGYDEQTEEYIGNVEELSGKIADLTKTASSPGGISLFTNEAKTEYKSTRKLFDDISKIYDELNDKQQAGLLEALAGDVYYPYVQKCA